MIKHILLISSLLVSGVVCAERPDTWTEILTDSNKSKTYVNGSRMKVVDGSSEKEVEVWMKVVSLVNSGTDKKGSFVLVKQRIRCTDLYYKFLQIVSYSKDKYVIGKYSYNDDKYQESLPDSINELVLTMVCNAAFNN